MKLTKRTSVAIVACLLAVSALAAKAVSFLTENQTADTTYRIRVFDRGGWRPWVVAGPGFKGNVAPKVTRNGHAVEIDVLENGRWVPFYRAVHGARACSRVVKVGGAGHSLRFSWYDQLPVCHKLVPSGTLARIIEVAGYIATVVGA